MKIKKYNRALAFFIAGYSDQKICKKLKVKIETLKKWKRIYKFEQRKKEWLENNKNKNPLLARFENKNAVGNKGNRTENRGLNIKLKGKDSLELETNFLSLAADIGALKDKTFVSFLDKGQVKTMRKNAQDFLKLTNNR